MPGLAVNIDHVATLREARKGKDPDPVAAAVIAELAGADGIICHLREDRRHIQDRDVRLLRKVVRSRLILEMAVSSEMVGIALNVRPDSVTLVPESRETLSVGGGLELIIHNKTLGETIGALQGNGIPVSVIIDPEPEQVKLAHQAGANGIHIHTGAFCEATGNNKRHQAFAKIVDTVKLAKKLKLSIAAGRGLGYTSIKRFRGLPEIGLYCIGHSIVSRAVLVGLDRAIREMRELAGVV